MISDRIKGILLRGGWIVFMLSLMLPMFDLSRPDGGVRTVGGIEFLIMFFTPLFWQEVPMAFPVTLGNAAMIGSITLARLTLKRQGRNLWVGVPCLVAAMAGIYHLSYQTFFADVRIGFWCWLLAMTACGLSGLLRGQVDEDLL